MKRKAAVTEMPLRRDSPYGSDFADDYAEDAGTDAEFRSVPRRGNRVRISFRGGLIPKTLWGRIAAGCALLALTGAAIAAGMGVRSYLLHDDHFVVASSDSIQISGESHLSRAQLLSIFGEDVGGNVFRIPLGERRAELESLPWVAHATVMRLLPDRLRVTVTERTPVAFVRQNRDIGLVDANGVLFDIPAPEAGDSGAPHYSFPVLTGISANDPLSTRAARMKIYLDFMQALNAGGENVTSRLSEVDVSDPEDVRAVLPDGSGGTDLLVHFGQEKYLERYHEYQKHLTEWKTQYPKLSAVDMRYERQVVLQMQPGATAPVAAAQSTPAASAAPTAAKSRATKVSPRIPATKARTARHKASARKFKRKPTGGSGQGAHR